MARSNFKVHVVINQSEHDSSPSTDQAAVEDKGHNGIVVSCHKRMGSIYVCKRRSHIEFVLFSSLSSSNTRTQNHKV